MNPSAQSIRNRLVEITSMDELQDFISELDKEIYDASMNESRDNIRSK